MVRLSASCLSCVSSKWRRRGLSSERIEPCLIGGGAYGLQTLPPTGAVSCGDVASLMARSQHDLCYAAAAAAATPSCGRGPRGYVTTLEMRAAAGAGYPPLGGSQPALWATAAPCPVHGTYGPVHHVYDAPLLDDDVTSPFYHELDGPGLHPDDGGPTPPPPPRPLGGDQDPIAAPFSKI